MVFSYVATNDDSRSPDAVDEYKHDVAVAAQEEREAQAALHAEPPTARDAGSADDGHRNALLMRWQAAAHALAVALENLDRAQRATERTSPHVNDQPPA